jgi:hypothetical protein
VRTIAKYLAILLLCCGVLAAQSLTSFTPYLQPSFPEAAGLWLQVSAGSTFIGNTTITIPVQRLALPANATTYVYLDTSLGVISSSSAGFASSGQYPIAIVQTNATFVTTLIDARPNLYLGAAGGTGSGTVLGGTAGYSTYYASNGTVVSPQTGLQWAGSNSTFAGNQTVNLGLNVLAGPLSLGASPPTACGAATACMAFPDSTGTVDPTAGQNTIRFISGVGNCTLDGGTEGTCFSSVTAGSQYSVPYYNLSGTQNSLAPLAAPTTPSGVVYTLASVPSSGAVAPSWDSPGSSGRNAPTPDTILATDCNYGARVTYVTSIATSVILPTPTTLGVPQCQLTIANDGTGVVTLCAGFTTYCSGTSTSWTISAGSAGSRAASLAIAAGQVVTVNVDPVTSSNWVVSQSDLVLNDRANTAAAGMTLNMAAATGANAFVLPNQSSCSTSSSTGAFCYDTTHSEIFGNVLGAGGNMYPLAGWNGTPTGNFLPTSTSSGPTLLHSSSISDNGSVVIVNAEPFYLENGSAAVVFGVNSSGQVINIGQNALVNNGVRGEVYATMSGTQTGNYGPVTMATSPSGSGSLYSISAYVEQVAAGVGCSTASTIQLQVTFQNPDASAATTVPFGTCAISTSTGNGSAFRPANCGGGTLGQAAGSYPFTVLQSTAVTFDTIFTAGTCSTSAPTYKVLPILEQL